MGEREKNSLRSSMNPALRDSKCICDCDCVYIQRKRAVELNVYERKEKQKKKENKLPDKLWQQ